MARWILGVGGIRGIRRGGGGGIGRWCGIRGRIRIRVWIRVVVVVRRGGGILCSLIHRRNFDRILFLDYDRPEEGKELNMCFWR